MVATPFSLVIKNPQILNIKKKLSINNKIISNKRQATNNF